MPAWPLPRPLRAATFAGATAVLLWLSLAPTEDLPGAIMFWDKAEHALAYLVLAAMGLVLFPRHRFVVAVYSLGVGIGVEFLQAAMGFGRQGDWRDAAAGAIGVGVALAADLLVRRARRRP